MVLHLAKLGMIDFVYLGITHIQTILLQRLHQIPLKMLLILPNLTLLHYPLSHLIRNRRNLKRLIRLQMQIRNQRIGLQRFNTLRHFAHHLRLHLKFTGHFISKCLMAQDIFFHRLVDPVYSLDSEGGGGEEFV